MDSKNDQKGLIALVQGITVTFVFLVSVAFVGLCGVMAFITIEAAVQNKCKQIEQLVQSEGC